MKSHFLMLGLCLAGALPALAQPFPITFAAPEYTEGNLKGQGSSETRWSAYPSSAASLSIADGLGPGGKSALLTAPVEERTEAYTFKTSDADLPGFDGSSSKVDFRIRLHVKGEQGTAGTSNFIIQIGYDAQLGSSAAQIKLSRSGRVKYNNGTSENEPTLDADSNTLVLRNDPEEWTEIGGRLDYAAKTWTLSVNGVPQGAGPLAFRAPVESAALRLINVAKEEAPHVPLAFDLLSLTLADGNEIGANH